MSYADVVILTAADRRYFVIVAESNQPPRGPQWKADRKLRAEGLIEETMRGNRRLTPRGRRIREAVFNVEADRYWRSLPFEAPR